MSQFRRGRVMGGLWCVFLLLMGCGSGGGVGPQAGLGPSPFPMSPPSVEPAPAPPAPRPEAGRDDPSTPEMTGTGQYVHRDTVPRVGAPPGAITAPSPWGPDGDHPPPADHGPRV